MKTTCPNCGTSHDIGDGKIIGYIENSPRFLAKVRKLLGRINRAMATEKATPEERSAHACNAAKKRWEKKPQNN